MFFTMWNFVKNIFNVLLLNCHVQTILYLTKDKNYPDLANMTFSIKINLSILEITWTWIWKVFSRNALWQKDEYIVNFDNTIFNQWSGKENVGVN